jgi:hypothetical protein
MRVQGCPVTWRACPYLEGLSLQSQKWCDVMLLQVWSTLFPTKQDLLIRLALGEIANLTNDEKSRQAIKTTAVNLMKTDTREMGVPNEA